MTCNDCTHYAGNGKCRKNKKGTTSPLKVADNLSCFDQAAPEKPVLPEENKPETKVCKGCGRELPLSSFSRNRSGIVGFCNDCMAAKRKATAERNKAHNDAPEIPKDEFEARKEALRNEGAIRIDPVPPITTFYDDELVEELRRRGYSGTLTKSVTINV